MMGGGWARRVGVVIEDVGDEGAEVVGGAMAVLEAQAMDEPCTHEDKEVNMSTSQQMNVLQ